MNRNSKIIFGIGILVVSLFILFTLPLWEIALRILVLIFFFVILFFVAILYDKIYFHSKNTWLTNPEIMPFFVFFAMPIFSILIFIIFLIISSMGDFLSILLLLFIPIFFVLLPGFYFASRKYFLFFSNQKLNLFPIRLLVLLPVASLFNIIFLLAACLCIPLFSPYLHELNVTSSIILTILSMFGSLSTILMFNSLLRNDLPPEYRPDFMEHELYLFRPQSTVSDYDFSRWVPFPASNSYGVLPKTRPHCFRYQINDLEIDLKKNEADLHFTTLGALIVSSKVLRIFEDNKLTGYETRSVRDKKTKQQFVNYFQIVPTSEMPKMSLQTKIKKRPSYLLEFGFFISDNIIHYDASVRIRASDFNKTTEYFGSNNGWPYLSQKFLIVSHKTMEILINQVGQKRRDFVPVVLVTDKNKMTTKS